jgi:hypothetical protein
MVIAIEILNEVKMFDPSVLNPINYLMVLLLDYALQKSPGNKTFLAWQVKVFSKLGMTSLVQDLGTKISRPEQGTGTGTGIPGSAAAKEYETIGFIKYSHFTEFMADRELEGLCR